MTKKVILPRHVGSQEDLLTPCLCNLTKNGYAWSCQGSAKILALCTATFQWHSLEIIGNLWWCLQVIGTSYTPFGMSGFFVGSQQDLLIPCLCNLAKIWICVILVRWCQDLTLCTATFGILWKSLGIFGDVQKSLELLQHHSECQVFF